MQLITNIGRAVRQLTNALLSRSALSQVIEGQEGRDIDATCGYPEVVTVADYHTMIARGGIPKRVNSVLPDESWRVPPLVYETADEGEETPFEAAWNALLATTKTNPWHYLHRADVESGKGHYGVLLLGISDGQPLDKPVAVRPENRLIFLRAFSQEHVRIAKYNDDVTSPDYGMPELYHIQFANPNTEASEEATGYFTGPDTDRTVEATTVHASRVLHVADNRTNSEVFGTPRLQEVYNYLLDLKKVAGGSSEMFWQGAQPGYAIETNKDIVNPTLDNESIRQQFDGFRNGLQRYLALEGMTIKSLAPQVADPSNHVMTQLNLICATIGVPLKSFLGSESGQLASETDRDSLNDRLTRRQLNYITPFLVRGFIALVVKAGCLPPPKQVFVDWADLNSMKEKDKAAISMQRVQALLQYVTSGAEKVMPLREFLTKIMYFSPKDADAIIEAVDANDVEYTKELWEQVQEGTGNPSDPTKKTGAAGKRNAQG